VIGDWLAMIDSVVTRGGRRCLVMEGSPVPYSDHT
jgi:hypothetical protein